MEKIKIIMDVDTGIDDAIAICLALGNESFEVLGLTTTYGNRPIEATTENTLKILELIGKEDIPVARGADKPIVKPYNPPEFSVVHGRDGLGDMKPPLPMPKIKPIEMSAVEFMAQQLKNSQEPITLVPVGPMTNVAALILAHPELKPKIKQVVLMGGSTLKGNVTFVSEANIMADPEAAHILFDSGLKLFMTCLDATWKGYISFEELDEYKKNGNPLSDKILGMCGIYEEHYKLRMKNPGIAMHDSLALAWLAKPELVKSADYYVTVDIDGRYTYGMTVTDVHNTLHKQPNATVSLDVDREPFICMIKDAIALLNEEKQNRTEQEN
ncbi:MAG: nucleoside hydrolase [Oscillospiraceae bacterium]